MLRAGVVLIVVSFLFPGIAIAAGHGEGVAQFRNAPFSDFDLTAIGIALVIVMVVLGWRAFMRRRGR